jgi:tRNA(Arg) A34 adenosine deaminase TadA
VYPTIEDRMGLVIELAQKNVDEKTGGPFGAGIFEMNSGRLVAPGVNRVEDFHCSILHAEIVAIMVAQKKLGRYDLGDSDLPSMELVTSVEPCAMCMGSVVWCGVRRLICGARDSDARAIGFDEGPKPENWVGELEKRGIAVIRDQSRNRAAQVLKAYLDHGGLIYNAARR